MFRPTLLRRTLSLCRFAAVLSASLALLLLTSSPAAAQSDEPFKATLTVRADQPKGVINRNIYGHFAEHIGRVIYDGIWVGKDSSIANTRGIRDDVVAALKDMSVPVLRWPGGCYADEYHWRDGIGPRHKRPRRVNTNWEGVIENNAFGTHEFMDLCEQIGSDAYVCGNVGSSTPQEMMEWIEYMTSDADSEIANLRRKNGRDKPWKVPYFSIGNENWGCGGNMRPEYYADEYRRFATFVKNYSGNRLQRICTGSSGDNYKWTEVLMHQAHPLMQGLSFHFYTMPTNKWEKKGSAVNFDEEEWHSTLVQTLRMEEFVQKHSAIMDKEDPKKRIGMIVDEWGTWYDTEPGSKLGLLFQQNSIRDAVVAGVNLNIFNQHCDRVTMANVAQILNVLQAVILTDGDKMLLTPTYHVFKMYKVHQGAKLIPVEIKAPEYRIYKDSVPSLHASASRDPKGKLHVSIVNLQPDLSAQVALKIDGANPQNITGQVLTAPAMNAVNTFDKPNAVKPVPFGGIKIEEEQITLEVPSKSVVVLELMEALSIETRTIKSN